MRRAMKFSQLSQGVLAELHRRHVDFLRDRLVSEAARQDWAGLARQSWQSFSALRVREVVDAKAAARALVRVLDADAIRKLVAPVLREAARETVASLRRDLTKLGV
jgi:hypothetical protein